MPVLTDTLDETLALIADGCTLVVPRETAGVAMAATRALIRRGLRNIHLVTLPTSTMQADMLIGAGCVSSIETSAVSLGEFGPAPRFAAAVSSDAVKVKNSTCPAVYAALQATEKGVPFIPMRGLIGSDILAGRPEWRVIDNPFGEDDPIVVIPALKADVALFHVPMADREGNVWIGGERELALMAHAAEKTIVTVEEIRDGSLFDDPVLAAGTLGGFYIETVALAPRGAWPLRLPGRYAADGAHLAEYARLAATPEGFARYLDSHVYDRRAA